jgi:peptide/nickel transport system ATP-binding protein
MSENLLEVSGLEKHFPITKGLYKRQVGAVRAVDRIDLQVRAGETLGLVGESGCGKSTTGRLFSRILEPTGGKIIFEGQDISHKSVSQMRPLRRDVQMIFQDPLSAMHPYFTVGSQIVEAYRVHHPGVNKKVARERAIDMLARVGIPQPERRFNDYAHLFSGGMRQRAMIAMALVNDPALLIADEPTTALDVTVQAQILDLIRDLQEEFGSAVIMITHDLGVVAELADDILVMYGGKVIEKGSALDVFRTPQHPYTWGLLGSMPRLDRDVRDRLIPVKGTPPSLINLPDGCAFHPRCPYAGRNGNRSFTEVPVLRDAGAGTGAGHLVACHLPAEDRTKIFQQEVLPNL